MTQLILAPNREAVRAKAEELGLGFTELQQVTHTPQLYGWKAGTVIWTVPGWERGFNRNELEQLDIFVRSREYKLVAAPTIYNTLLAKLANFTNEPYLKSEQARPTAQSFSITRREAAKLLELLEAHVNDSETLKRLFAIYRQREALGREKYGTDVDRIDLSRKDWRRHLYEELLDATLYATREDSSP